MKRILLATMVLFFSATASAQEQGKNPEGPYLPLLGYHQEKLLVARPGMPDIRFRQSVILLVEHSEKGAFGLMMNRIVQKMPLSALYRSFGIKASEKSSQVNVHYGGPVSPDSGFVLHTTEHEFEVGYKVGKEVALSPMKKVLRAMARGKRPKKIVFLVGYAGWGGGQLEREMRRGDWYTAPADLDILFDDDHESKWSRAMERRFRVM